MTQSVIFTPSPVLTFQTVGLERKRLLVDIQSYSHLIVYIDLSNIVTCDSAGLALLLEVKRICNKASHILIMQGMSPAVMSLAEFCGLKMILMSEIESI